MGFRSTDGSDHAGFARTADVTDGRRQGWVSIAVVATLALAILASAAAVGLDRSDREDGRIGRAAWNIGHGAPGVAAGG